MDHFTLTLILGFIEAVVIPWAIWVTVKHFDLRTKVAVLESSATHENNSQGIQNKEINNKLEKMDKEIDEMKKEMNAGFMNILNEMRK